MTIFEARNASFRGRVTVPSKALGCDCFSYSTRIRFYDLYEMVLLLKIHYGGSILMVLSRPYGLLYLNKFGIKTKRIDKSC